MNILFADAQQMVSHHLKDVTPAPITNVVSPHISPKTSQKQVTQEGEDITELVEHLKQTNDLQEQADLIHYLYIRK